MNVYLLLALATISVTVTHSYLFRKIRIVKLLKCHYCFNHWLAIMTFPLHCNSVNVIDIIISVFAVTFVTSVLTSTLILLLETVDVQVQKNN